MSLKRADRTRVSESQQMIFVSCEKFFTVFEIRPVLDGKPQIFLTFFIQLQICKCSPQLDH